MDEITLSSEHATTLRSNLARSQRTMWWLKLTALFIMPVFLGVVGNVLVAVSFAEEPNKFLIATTAILFGVCALLQIVLGIAALREGSDSGVLDFSTLATKLTGLEDCLEINRDVHNTLRSSFDEYNAQVCNVSGWCENEFRHLLDPIFSSTRAKIDKVLGVTDRVYSIELYLDGDEIHDFTIDWKTLEEIPVEMPKLGSSNLKLWYFHGSERVSDADALAMGDRHPAIMAWTTNVADEYSIEKHSNLYGTPDNLAADVYFNRVLTAPVRVVCQTTDFWGVLVLTTRQRSELSSEAIDNFQWLSTLTTNFVAAFNKCKAEQSEDLVSQRRSRSQQQRREREREETVDAAEDSDDPNGEMETSA